MSTTPTPASAPSTYSIEPVHSRAHFKVRHMMIANVRGEFSKISGTVKFDPRSLALSGISAEIDVQSLSTREPQRDEHLKSADFLDAANFPVIKFQSKKIEADGPAGYKVTGDLTIRGATQEVVLFVEGPTPEVKDPWGSVRRGAEASTRIHRKDFGLTWNVTLETGGWLVGDEVEISLEVEMVRPA